MIVRDYVLLRKLGQGAMALIYLGRHRQTGQEVAIKFLSSDYAEKKEFVSRFLNEAALSATLDHENIVHVYEAGEDGGIYFMVMEYVKGVNLGHFLKDECAIKEKEVVPWLKQAAQALAYAHSRGIVHRDIKPENIMLTPSRRLKITDLGLSKDLGADENLSMTLSGTVMGTPYYISPEQAKNAKRVDARTDIYSLGATFYHLMAGSPPFPGRSAVEVMAKHMDEPLVSPQRKNPALSDGFCDLLLKMMEKDPARRFQNMQEVVEAVERLERGEPAVFHKVKLREKTVADSAIRKPLRGGKRLRWALGAAVGTFLAGSAFFILKPATQPAQEATGALRPGLAVQKEGTVAQTMEGKVLRPEGSVKPSDGRGGELSYTEDGKPVFRGWAGPVNWVDGFGVVAVLLGVSMATCLGYFWGAIRAVAFWAAVVIVCSWFGEMASWLQITLSVSASSSAQVSFFALSVLTLLPAWVLTNRLVGYQKETWQYQLNRILAVIPGLALGGACAVWFFALLALVGADAFPLNESWFGSKVPAHFPAIRQFMKVPR